MTSTYPCHSYFQQYFLSCLGLPYELFLLIWPSLHLSPRPICSITNHSWLSWHTLLFASLTPLFFAYRSWKLPAEAENTHAHFPRLSCSSPAEPPLKILANEMWGEYPGDLWESFPSWHRETLLRSAPFPFTSFFLLWTLPCEEVILSPASATCWDSRTKRWKEPVSLMTSLSGWLSTGTYVLGSYRRWVWRINWSKIGRSLI